MSPLLSRIAALAVTAAIIALVVLGLVLPVLELRRDRAEERAHLEAQLDRLVAILSEARPKAALEVGEPALIDAATPALAAAEMQARVKSAVAAAKAELKSVRIDAALPGELAVAVPLSAEIETEMDSLATLLHRIEQARPYLRITRLEARRLRMAAPTEPQRIQLRLRIVGMIAGEG